MKYTQSRGQDTGKIRTKKLIAQSKPSPDQLQKMPVRDMSRREKKPVPSRRKPSEFTSGSASGGSVYGKNTVHGTPDNRREVNIQKNNAPERPQNRQSAPSRPGMPIRRRPDRYFYRDTVQRGIPDSEIVSKNRPGENKPADFGMPSGASGAAPNGVPNGVHDGVTNGIHVGVPYGAPNGAAMNNPGREKAPIGHRKSSAMENGYGTKKTQRGKNKKASEKKSSAKSPMTSRLPEFLRYPVQEAVQWISGAARIIKGRLGEFSIDGIGLSKAAVLTALMLILILLQTTVCHRFTFFGAIPDLMLPFVIATAASEGEKWGGILGLAAAFFSEALGSTGFAILPLLYSVTGYVCGLLGRYYLTGSIAVRVLYSLAGAVLRGLFTWFYILSLDISFDGIYVFFHTILPEAAITLICSVPVHLIIWLSMKPFHKTRDQKVID